MTSPLDPRRSVERFRPVTRAARFPDDVAAVRRLFTAYAARLPISLCFQGFEDELATLPGRYAAPNGAVLLAEYDGAAIGVVAVRPLEPGVCEMKRLFVDPAHRGHGVSRTLAEGILAQARSQGYQRIRLDTLADMHPARRLYESLGFAEIDAYYQNPDPRAVFYEMGL